VPRATHTPSYGALRQYSKPIIALLTVSILAVSIIAASFFAFSHFVATAPLVIDQSLPQTSTPTATPTAIPAPSPAAYIQATPTASPAPTPTPQPPTPTNNLNTRPIMIVQNQTITNTTLSQGINNEELYAVVQSIGSLQGNLWLNVRFNALAGYTKSSGARGSDMLLIKTEQTLSSVLMPLFNRMDVYKNSVLWEKTYGGSLDDEAKGIVLSSDGGYILAGYTKSFGAGASDMYLVRTDSNGTMLWNMTYGGAKDDGANSIVRAADGGYVLAGYTNSNVQSQSTWIVKVNASGQMQWNTICDGQAATSIATTSDGGYVLTVEHPNAYGLVKINSIGQVQWNRTYPIPSYSGRA
jgi:hypothetical protein